MNGVASIFELECVEWKTFFSHSLFKGPPIRQMAALPKTSSGDSLSQIVSDSIDFRLRNTADALQQVNPLLPDYEAVAESIFSLADEGAIINVLRLYNENASIWTLKLCTILLNPTQGQYRSRKSISLNLWTQTWTRLDTYFPSPWSLITTC